jgi:hypothetical protein
MSIFGDEDPTSDSALLKAVRKRLLNEISAKQAASSVINNNVYGGSAHAGGSDVGGLLGSMGGAPAAAGEDPFDYLVDIERKDLPINPETGKPEGWRKSVRRHRTPKDEKKK